MSFLCVIFFLFVRLEAPVEPPGFDYRRDRVRVLSFVSRTLFLSRSLSVIDKVDNVVKIQGGVYSGQAWRRLCVFCNCVVGLTHLAKVLLVSAKLLQCSTYVIGF